MTKDYVCIVCPNSCRLQVSDDSGEIRVTGNRCKRGRDHGIREFTCPMRMITSTVAITGGIQPRLSVISTDVVPKDRIRDCLQEIYGLKVTAPVRCGDILLKNVSDTGVDIVASRSMIAKE